MLQPIIGQVVQYLLAVLISILMGAILGAGRRVTRWLDSKTSANQRDLLHKMAAEAVAYAKVVFKEQGGEQKLQAALGYVNARLAPHGIKITEQELRAAVEKAYLDYKAMTTQPVAPDPITIEVPVEKPMAPELQQLIDAAKAVATVQQPATPDIPQQTNLSA